ncbi:hypothetical protein ACFX5U_19930 [Sphingobacterium sp. SG20118]|uniref:hypothetical protein n=1 Tax=Sphingobacterium sp. SG20118 TaxID=3367156 RepID=UPI0037DFC279
MKKIHLFFIMILSSFCFLKCSKDNLDVFKLVENRDVEVNAEGAGTDLVKTNDYVRVPMRVKLSAPASKTFDVEIQLNTDTVNSLIKAGVLKDVVALPNNAFTFPNVVKFPVRDRYSILRIDDITYRNRAHIWEIICTLL